MRKVECIIAILHDFNWEWRFIYDFSCLLCAMPLPNSRTCQLHLQAKLISRPPDVHLHPAASPLSITVLLSNRVFVNLPRASRKGICFVVLCYLCVLRVFKSSLVDAVNFSRLLFHSLPVLLIRTHARPLRTFIPVPGQCFQGVRANSLDIAKTQASSSFRGQINYLPVVASSGAACNAGLACLPSLPNLFFSSASCTQSPTSLST